MTTNQLGIRNSNIIVPYTAATKRTKEVALSLSGTNYSSTSFASGVAFADSAGVWRISLNISANTSSSSSGTIVISGVSFSGSQVVASLPNGGSSSAYTANGNGTITWSSTANSTNILLSETLLLASKPTWADANMEGVLPVDVYIPPASAGIAGLVNNVAGNTAGTPILGKTDGVAVASGYMGEKIAGSLSGSSSLTASAADWSSITLTAGTWLVLYSVPMSYTANNGYGYAALQITDSSNNVIQEQEKIVGVQAAPSTVMKGSGEAVGFFVAPLSAASTVYKIRAYYVVGSGAGSGSIYNEAAVRAEFFAVRIA